MYKKSLMPCLAVICLALTSCNRSSDPATPKDSQKEKQSSVQDVSSKSSSVAEANSKWPALPAKGFITGRAATNKDIADGNAAFVLQGSKAMNIDIPQYAYHTDTETGKRTAGILIQAERTPDGKQLAAIQSIGEGGQLIGLLSEFKLLGKVPPKGD